MTKDQADTGADAGKLPSPLPRPPAALWRLRPEEVADLPAPSDPAWRGAARAAPPGLYQAALAAGSLAAGQMPPHPALAPDGARPPADLQARDALLGMAAACLAGEAAPWPQALPDLERAMAGLPALRHLPPGPRRRAAPQHLAGPWREALRFLAEPRVERAVGLLAAALARPGPPDQAAWRLACAAAVVALAAVPRLSPAAPRPSRSGLARAADITLALAAWALVAGLGVAGLIALAALLAGALPAGALPAGALPAAG